MDFNGMLRVEKNVDVVSIFIIWNTKPATIYYS